MIVKYILNTNFIELLLHICYIDIERQKACLLSKTEVNILEILNYISTIFTNAFIVCYFYLQMYFYQIVLFIILVIAGIIEFKEKEFLTVDDERKVV